MCTWDFAVRHISLCCGVIINSISVERAAKKVDVT